MVSTDLSFLFANKTAETLATSGHHEIGRRQENNQTAETLDMSGTDKMTARQSISKWEIGTARAHKAWREMLQLMLNYSLSSMGSVLRLFGNLVLPFPAL